MSQTRFLAPTAACFALALLAGCPGEGAPGAREAEGVAKGAPPEKDAPTKTAEKSGEKTEADPIPEEPKTSKVLAPELHPEAKAIGLELRGLFPGDGKGNSVTHRKLVKRGRIAGDAIMCWVFPTPDRAWLQLQRIPPALAVRGMQFNAAHVLAELRYTPALQTLEEFRAGLSDPEEQEALDLALKKLRRTTFFCTKCQDKPLTRQVGRCGKRRKGCAEQTGSGMVSTCPPCARQLGRCQLCGHAIPFALPSEPVLRATITGLIPGDGRAGGLASRALVTWGSPACRVLARRLFPIDPDWLRMDGEVPGEWWEGMQAAAAEVFAQVGFVQGMLAIEDAQGRAKDPDTKKRLARAHARLVELSKKHPAPLVPR